MGLDPTSFDAAFGRVQNSRIIWTAEAIAAKIGCSADYVRRTLAKLPESPVKKIGSRYCAHEGDLVAFFRTDQ